MRDARDVADKAGEAAGQVDREHVKRDGECNANRNKWALAIRAGSHYGNDTPSRFRTKL